MQTLDWIETQEVTNSALVKVLQISLDAGEAEALALAIELRADLLLLDERRARLVASRLGLKFIGLLGVLIEAKLKGLISSIKPLLDELMSRAGFWMTQDLYARVLQAAGE